MFKRVLVLILFCCSAIPANARVNYFVNCSSSGFNLIFEINPLFRTVRNVDYNTEMDVAYWGEEAINTTFSIRKSFSQIVRGTHKSENVSVNFDRLKGTASIAGINSPTKSQIKECKLKRSWGCESWFVTEMFSAKCSIIEQKF